jgi:hypothetical protein
MIKSRRGGERSAYEVLVGNHEEESPLRPRHRCEDNIKMDPK